MTLNMPQIVQETCMLVAKLQDRDRLADSLISQAQMLNEKITCMKQYQDQLHEMNEVVHHRPRSALVYNLQQENRQIKLLESENRQLKAALQEHHAALELIMAKYRQHVLQLLKLNRLQELIEQQCSSSDAAESISDRTRLLDFAHLFDQCLQSGEAASHKDQTEIARLLLENESLRRVMQAAMVNQPGLAKEHRRIRQELLVERSDLESHAHTAGAHADPSVSADVNPTAVATADNDDATPDAEDKSFASGISAADNSNANVVSSPKAALVEAAAVNNNHPPAAKPTGAAKEQKMSTIKKSTSGGVSAVLSKMSGSEEPTDPSGPHGTSAIFKRTSSAKTSPATNNNAKANLAKRKSADEGGGGGELKISSSTGAAKSKSPANKPGGSKT